MAKEQSNRQDQSELSSLKGEIGARHRGAAAGVNVLARAEKAHPNDPKRQLAAFLRDFVIKSGTGRLRPVSQETSSKYTETLMKIIDELRSERAAIRNLSEIGKPHAVRLIGAWVRDGQSTGTIQNKTSILRRFLTFLGKENLIPRGAQLKTWMTANGIQPPESRTIVARTSKAWDQHDVDVFDVLKKVEAECPLTAIQLEMQVAFGLRMKESICIIPRVADRGTVLSVVWGTKGGLPREVRFDDDLGVASWQRDVLERAKLMAEQNKKGTLSLQGKTLEQSRDRFYYIVRKHGISRAGLGVTAHGLRHQFAARRYQEISGFGAPVTAHAPATNAAVAEADLHARTELSRELGHFRPSITQAYTGSFPLRDRGRSSRVQPWIDQTEKNPRFLAVLAEHGIERAWLGGSFAAGLEVGPHEKLRLFLAPAAGTTLDADARFMLKNALNEIYRRGVDITIHTDEGDPDDCVELHLPVKPKT
jgi:site-specific recombinase XerD